MSEKVNVAEMMAELARLRAENEALAAKETARQTIRFKVSEKGAVSVYGINSRFPVTLYRQQWERVIQHVDQLKAFITENEAKLATK